MPGSNKNTLKFTKTNLRKLEPRAKPYSVYDEEGYGLRLIVLRSGVKSFQIYKRIPGSSAPPQTVTIGKFCNAKGEILMLPDQAKALAREKYAELANGINVNQKKVEKKREELRKRTLTLGTFLSERFEPWASQELKSGQHNITSIKRNFKHWFDKPMHEITKAMVVEWRTDFVQKGRKPATANREISSLRGVFSRAVEWEVIEFHPLRGLKPLKIDKNPRPRHLTQEEENRLRAALDAREQREREKRQRYNQWLEERHRELLPEHNETFLDYLKPLVLLAINTGMRRSELFNLTWDDVSLSSKLVTVVGTGKKETTGTKSGHTRHINLSNEAFWVLEQWRQQNPEAIYVFPNPETGQRLQDIKTAFTAVLKEARLHFPQSDPRYFTFHHLRHTFASKLIMQGASLYAVKALLGHESIETTQIYAHLSPEHQSSVIDLLN